MGSTHLHQLPNILDSAALTTRDVRAQPARAGAFGPTAPMVEPAQLVARALALLAEETEAWRLRRAADPSLEKPR